MALVRDEPAVAAERLLVDVQIVERRRWFTSTADAVITEDRHAGECKLREPAVVVADIEQRLLDGAAHGVEDRFRR